MTARVDFLGAGDAFNAAARCHASYLVRSPSACFLLDCGPTVLLALKRAAIASNQIDSIFLSHLHGDHFAGVPFLLLSWVYETGRQRPVTVIGPPGTEERIHTLYRTLYKELASRPLPFELRCIEVEPAQRIRVGAVDLLPFRVPHQEKEISLGLRCAVDGKVILYSGDTGWTEDLVTHSQGTDLFICECCYYETRVDFHLDYPRLRDNHRRFGCRRLVLTHTGAEVHAHRSEIDLEIAEDGSTIEL